MAQMLAFPPPATRPELCHLSVTQTPAKEKAKEGETVVLKCHFDGPQCPSLSELMVRWYKEDEKGQMDLLENNVTILPNNCRVFMSGDLSQGDVSLVILNVTTSDHGIYFCAITLPDGKVVTGDGTKLQTPFLDIFFFQTNSSHYSIRNYKCHK
uniref:Ig-like domain-containing protein n=1 Tax=Nothoprocta perdicaria TaxID=30464 RepID=A0A8C6YQJ4_NOTPE